MASVGFRGARSFRCCRASPARSRYHGDTHDRGREGPADDDPYRAVDDLFGTASVYTLIIGAFVPIGR